MCCQFFAAVLLCKGLVKFYECQEKTGSKQKMLIMAKQRLVKNADRNKAATFKKYYGRF